MAWKKLSLEPKIESQDFALVAGECNKCGQCCICWFYDTPDQPDSVPPRKGWCPQLDMEKKTCRVWESRPDGCRSFPTLRDFELGAVPDGCGFKLIK